MSRLRPLVAEYLATCRSRNLSPETVAWYTFKLTPFAERCAQVDSHDLTALHLYDFLASVAHQSDTSRKGFAQVLRAFLRWAVEEGEVDSRLPGKVQMPRVAHRLLHPFTESQFERLLDAATLDGPQSWFPARDQAILWTLCSTGVRASELCHLRRADLHLDESYLVVVCGKGRKEREVGPLPLGMTRTLRRYLRAAPVSDTLFLTRYRTALTRNGLDQLLTRLRDWAGGEHFAGVRVSAHTFRHTYATNYLRAGGEIKALSLLLGHTSVSTTERYLRDLDTKDARRGNIVSAFVRS